MTSNLFPTGVELMDAADVLAACNYKQTAYAAGVVAGTIPQGTITGGQFVCLVSASTTPGTQTTRTAAQMFADDPLAYPGQTYILRVAQSGAGTMTLAGGTGVTISGTATVATATFRDFMVQVTAPAGVPAYTITNIGTGTYS